jgi:hypothetical protein
MKEAIIFHLEGLHLEGLPIPQPITECQYIEALFDGQVFHPHESVNRKANTRVRIIIEPLLPQDEDSISFLDTATSLNFKRPLDWSKNRDKYL